MKTMTPEFEASLDAYRKAGGTIAFKERVEIDWDADTTISYSPLATDGTRQTPLLDDNPYSFDLPDASNTIINNVRRGVHPGRPVRVYITYDGVNEVLDYEGTLSARATIGKIQVQLNARGVFAGLGSNGKQRVGSREYHRRYVDANDSLFDEAGDSRRDANKKIGSRR